jgi:predicted ATPase
VIVGSIGDDLRMDYTAVGDTTNLASRMQGLASPGSVLISAHTHRLARDFFEFKSLGEMPVKGKEEPQEAYELVGIGEVTTRIAASQAKGLTRFVGRESAMGSLVEGYEKARSGSGQVVGIVGEAGVGKSRLLLEFRNRLPTDEFTYLEGRCLHFGGAMAYLPILDILRSYLSVKEGEQEAVIRKRMTDKISELDEKLEPVLTPLQDLLSLKVEDEAYLNLEPKQRRERVFEAIRDLLVRESQEKALVLAVEDLHWIDKTTEEFLDYLIGRLPNVRVLLLLLYRPEYTHQWGSKSYFNRIGLDHLSLRSSAELVRAILEGGEVAEELRELILNRAAGNPLFMEELTHSLLENGAIRKEKDQYVLSRKSSDLEVPETIQGIIASRLDRLEENLKRIMQVASVIGREFAFRILETITGMREDLKTSLTNLQGLELIYEKQLFPELEYIFKHALTQEVAYNSLLVKRRKEIHERIGEAMERIYGERLEEFYEMLGYHYSQGDNPMRAYRYLKLSGDKAARTWANWEAVRFYKEAMQMLDSQQETEETKRDKLDVCLSMYNPLTLLGYPERSHETLQEAERLSRELEDARSLAYVYGRLGNYFSITGRLTLGSEYSEKAIDEAEKIGSIELIAPGAADFCVAQMHTGNYSRVVDVASRVLRLLEEQKRGGDRFGRNYALHSLLSGCCGFASGMAGSFDEGKAVFEQGRRNALQTDDRFGMGMLTGFHALFSYFEGDGYSTVDHSQEAFHYFEETAGLQWRGWAGMFLGTGYYLLGQYEIARNHGEEGLKASKEGGASIMLPINYNYLALISEALGDVRSAREYVEQALQLSQQYQSKAYEAWAWMVLGSIEGKADPTHIEAAAEHIRQGISIAEGTKAKAFSAQGYLFLGELFADAGRKEAALENLKKAEAMYLEMKVTPKSHWLARTREALDRL